MLDVGAGLVVVVMALMAFQRGLVGEVLILVSWIAAAALAYSAFPLCQLVMGALISPDYLADGVAAGVPFVILLVVFERLAHKLSAGARGSMLGTADRVVGMAFGAVRAGYVICLVMLLLSRAIPVQNQASWLRESTVLWLVHDYGATALTALVGAEVVDGVFRSFDTSVAKARQAAKQREARSP